MRCRRRCVRNQRGASGGWFGGGEIGQPFPDVMRRISARSNRAGSPRSARGVRRPSPSCRGNGTIRDTAPQSQVLLLQLEKTGCLGGGRRCRSAAFLGSGSHASPLPRRQGRRKTPGSTVIQPQLTVRCRIAACSESVIPYLAVSLLPT